MTMLYSVLIVDGPPLQRHGIAHVIGPEPRLRLAGEAAGRRDARRAVIRHRPDVVVVDLATAEAFDVDAIRHLCELQPGVGVVGIGSAGPLRGAAVQDVLRSGARGFLQADTSAEELVACLLRVAEGGTYLTDAAAACLSEELCFDSLSRRELDILKLLSTGMSNRDIGFAAGIAEDTVKTHVNSILSKLGAASRTGAVSVAVRRGVIRLS